MRVQLSPLQDALFSCPYFVIEDVRASGLTGIAGNELPPLCCNHYFEGQWMGQDSRLYGPVPSKLW